MCSSTLRPECCHRISVSTAKLCLRSCARGWTVAVRMPSEVVIFLRVLATPLRSSLVPAEETKNAPAAGSRAEAVAFGGVAPQDLCDRGVQRDQPGAVELCVADRNDPGLQVDVVAVETDRLADPHAAGSEQPEQRLVGRRPKSWAQRSCAPAAGDR